MKLIKSRYFLSANYTVCIILGLIISFDSPLDGLGLVSLPLRFVVDGLTYLSQASTIGNIAAWIIFILFALVPSAAVWFITKQKKKQGIIRFTALLLSAFMFISVYGIMNHWFVNQTAAAFPGIETLPSSNAIAGQGFYRLIAIILVEAIIVLFVILIGMLMMFKSNNKKNILVRFMTGLWIFAELNAIKAGLAHGFVLRQLAGAGFQDIQLLLAMIFNIIMMNARLGFVDLIRTFVASYDQSEFSGASTRAANRLARYARHVFVFGLTGTIFLSVLMLMGIPGSTALNVEINISFVEILLALAVMFVVSLVEHGEALQRENQEFI